MGLFDKLFNKKEELETVDNQEIVAIADGEMFDVSTVSDELFASKAMGDGVAFKFTQDKVTLCSPVNGKLAVLFPTGHAFGCMMGDGVEILVHCGINTVEANGEGFKILKKKHHNEFCCDVFCHLLFNYICNYLFRNCFFWNSWFFCF